MLYEVITIVDGDSNASAETKAYIKEKLRDAVWLIKSMQSYNFV